jgi:hypothetical protein
MPLSSPPAWKRLAIAAGLAAAAVALYLPAVGHEFLNYDDDFLISENDAVALGLSWEGLAWAARDTSHGNWFPMTRLSLLLDQELHGLSAAGVHASNLALHAASVALLFLALLRMTRAAGPSVCAAALFAVHPLTVESVAWAAERKGLLAGFFWMATLWVYGGVGRRPLTWRRGIWVTIGVAACLSSKAVGVTLPAVLLLLDVWPLCRIRGAGDPPEAGVRLRRAVAEKLPLVALAVAFSAITVLTQSASAATVSLDRVPVVMRLMNAAIGYVTYGARFVWPTRLSVFYPYHEALPPVATVAAAIALLAAITGVVLWQLRRRPFLAVGWAWYLGVLVPMIGLVQVGSQATADRYAYLPLVGLAIALSWLAAEAYGRLGRWRTALPVAAIVVLVLLATQTRRQLSHWRNSETLFTHALAVTERNHIAHAQLGITFLESGRSGEALTQFRASIAIRPDFLETANNLAWLLATLPDPALRDPDEAVRLARAAAKQVGGQDPRVLDTLAAAHAAAGRFDRAAWYASRALRIASARGDTAVAEAIRTRLALYREGEPYHEAPKKLPRPPSNDPN